MSAQPPNRRPGAWGRKREYDPTSGLLDGVLATLSPPIVEGHEKDITLEDLVYIGSYNWVEAPEPTIIVPGSPRIWAEKAMPIRVPVNSGLNFIHQNGHRMGNFEMLPLIRAVQDTTDQGVTPKFDWSSVDIVTDRGRLRKLIAWATGLSDTWRIDTQLAGTSTVLLTGSAPVTKETSGHSTSYGFNFEEAATYPAPGLEDETGHCRVVSYNFSGLKMVVRFEVDACLPYDALPTTSYDALPMSSYDALPMSSYNALPASSYDKTAPPKSGKESTTKELPSRLSSNPRDVKIVRAGSQVPQTHLLEIKTGFSPRPKWDRAYSQLYLSQTPHIYHAVHNNGVFTSVMKFALGQNELMDADKRAQMGFKKLRKLLDDIKSLVLKHGAMRISLVCVGKTLSVYRMPQGESCLPEDALALFVV